MDDQMNEKTHQVIFYRQASQSAVWIEISNRRKSFVFYNIIISFQGTRIQMDNPLTKDWMHMPWSYSKPLPNINRYLTPHWWDILYVRRENKVSNFLLNPSFLLDLHLGKASINITFCQMSWMKYTLGRLIWNGQFPNALHMLEV